MASRVSGRVLVALVAAVAAYGPWALARAAVAPRTVLIVHSGAEDFPVNPLIQAGIRETLRSRPDVPVNYFTEYLDDQFRGESTEPALADYIQRKYQGRRIDLVIATTDRGLRFVLNHRAELFPEAPVVYSGLSAPDDVVRSSGGGVAGVRVGIAFPETVKVALALHPDTERLYVVSDQDDETIEKRIRTESGEAVHRVTLDFLREPSLPRLLDAIRAVPPRSLILYMFYSQVEPGRRMYGDEIASLVVAAARVPVYGTNDLYIGSGVVGGVVRDTHETGVRLAAIAMQILAGAKAKDIPIEETRVRPIFDWRALQRWDIPESRLPAGSVVRFRGPSLWRDFRSDVLIALVALIVQSALIAGLLFQRRARRRAEIDSRRNLALAADANRRVTMSALTGSIAHDLSQPLNAIMHNAQAGVMLMGSKRATPEVLRDILSDIEAADLRATQIIERHRTMLKSRPLDPQPIDIHTVVRESLALTAQDTRARHVDVAVDLPSGPCMVVGDQVLLQQVLVNLMLNAMEAMDQTPRDRRRVGVRSAPGAGVVEISVRDSGTGLANVDGKLFEPFVTTKANGIGIGLTIVRNIVEAHRGRLEALNNPDGGATFTVTLPTSPNRDEAAST